MQIEIVYQVDDELYEAFQRLIPQLTHNTPPPTREDLLLLLGILRLHCWLPVPKKNESSAF